MLASASELRAGLRRGIDPAKAKNAPEAKTTFGDFADAYLKSITTGERDWKRDLKVRCGSLLVEGFPGHQRMTCLAF